MRGIYLLFTTLMLFFLSSAQSLVPISISVEESQALESTSQKSSSSITDASSSDSTTTKTITNTIAVASFLPTSSTSVTPETTGDALGTVTAISSSPSSTTTSSSSSSGLSRQNLIIILASVLGTVAIIAVALVVFFCVRSRKRRSLDGRGVTPIDDEEIESWRRSAQDKKAAYTHDNNGAFDKETGGYGNLDSNTIQLTHSPGWTWTASPTSSRSRSTFYPSGVSGTIPDTPRFFAQAFAPNARIGLTDETIPGADPFIKPAKRQSSRLSKSSPGHARTKSRRSSMSGRSIWSVKSGHQAELKANDRVATWFDPEDDYRAIHPTFNNSSDMSLRASTGPITPLSPRPSTRPAYWDRDSRPSFWDRDPEIGEIGLAIS